MGATNGQSAIDLDLATSPTLSICSATNVGLVRERNEDVFAVADLGSGISLGSGSEWRLSLSDSGILLAVSDGMGGYAAGEVAARLSAEFILRTLLDAGVTVRTLPVMSLMLAFEAANRAILSESRRRARTRGMGTTCTAALAFPHGLIVAQVGDSRAYLFRNGSLRRLTRDQSLAAALEEWGMLAPEQAKDFPHSHVILQALGVEENVNPVACETASQSGDVVLLSSDGLHGYVSDNDIGAVLRGTDDLAACSRALIGAALDAGGPDNVTVVLARYEGASALA